MPALCPDCGWDLEGQRDALVLHCRQLQGVLVSVRRKADAGGILLPSRMPKTACITLPFWQITCDISEIALRTYADLVESRQPAEMVDSESVEGAEFRFWTPAFKLRAQAFLRLAESLTLDPGPGDARTPACRPKRHHPVTLPVEEACESLKVVLAGFLKPRRQVADMLARISIHPTHFRLAYLPFREDRHDLHPTPDPARRQQEPAQPLQQPVKFGQTASGDSDASLLARPRVDVKNSPADLGPLLHAFLARNRSNGPAG
ncbi:MAG: hypothetical protein MZV70_76215 [Desulfobacterales bacterium]|nr:hypothetical protein [Desulfobacterales bacterium]